MNFSIRPRFWNIAIALLPFAYLRVLGMDFLSLMVWTIIFYTIGSVNIKPVGKPFKLIHYITGTLVLIFLLNFFLLFPHPGLYLEQTYRERIGLEEVSRLDIQYVSSLTNLLKEENISPYDLRKAISEIIEYKSDFESIGNYEFWQTPRETILIRTGDCEDISILTLAVSREMDKDQEYKEKFQLKEIKTELKEEPRHIYIETNGKQEGKVNNINLTFFGNIIDIFYLTLPPIRRFQEIIGIIFIIFRFKFRRKNEPKTR